MFPPIQFAILSAMPEELTYLNKVFGEYPCEYITVGEFQFKVISYEGHHILLGHSGIGTAFAACMMTLIHVILKPNYFLIVGTAGSIDATLNIKDVIIVEKAFEAEMHSLAEAVQNTPFVTCLQHPLNNQTIPVVYSANSELLLLCDSLGVLHKKGTVVSSNAFPAPLDLFQKIKVLSPLAIDMETSAFYQTAWLLKAKVLAIRGISNKLNIDGTDDNIAESDVLGSSEAAGRVILEIIRIVSLSN